MTDMTDLSIDAILLAKSRLEELTQRVQELEEALRQAADVLAMLTDPERIRTSRVQEAWAQAVATEAHARSVLNKETSRA